jgi:hypothetical protein
MRVTPAPDVVIRVFMLFRGVRPEDMSLRAEGRSRDCGGWCDVLDEGCGVGATRKSDPRFFRVLE